MDRKILIIGMGKSGLAAAKTLAAAGADITITDTKEAKELAEALQTLAGWQIKIITGGCPEVRPEQFELVVTSPGVPVWAKPLQQAVKHGIPVFSEIELAYRFAQGPMVAITGTNGKTTTTALIGQMFKDTGRSVSVAGNIGIPLIQEVVQKPRSHVFIVEVSSFQLEWVEEFHPQVALITNLAPDHLERHGTMADYLAAKERIFQKQTEKDYTIINYDDLVIRELAKETLGQVIFFSRQHKLEKGVFANGENIYLRTGADEEVVCSLAELTMPGTHNLENVLGAVAAGWAMGLSPSQMARTLRTFPGVPHRLERVAKIRGVEYINDSKGTNPEAAIKAIEAFAQPLILIAGGSSKGNVDFTAFAQQINERVQDLILVGETAEEILIAVQETGFARARVVADLEEGIGLAADLARPGDLVLLSPACASFDFFKDFEHRGEVFKNLVLRLESSG